MKYVALLRGINVGGNNLIKMTDLKICFEQNRFKNVTTFIQSGNVIFESQERNETKLTKKIEKILSERFHYESKIVLVSHPNLKKILADAPKDWKNRKDLRHNVLFIKPPVTAEQVLADLNPKEGVDFVKVGKNAIYVGTLIAQATKSGLPKLISKKTYKEVTIRNYNTTQKLGAMLEKKTSN